MSRKKISTTVYLTPEQDERLKAINARTKVSVSEYIRQGIDLVLARYETEQDGMLMFRHVLDDGHRRIVAEVAGMMGREFGVSWSQILGRDRHEPLATHRQIAMALCRRRGVSFAAIGDAFERDHTTVVANCLAAEKSSVALLDRLAGGVAAEARS